MKFFALVEVVLGLLAIIIIVSQLIVPAVHGLPLFPLLRKRRLQAEAELADATEEAEVEETRRRAAEIRSRSAAVEPDTTSTTSN